MHPMNDATMAAKIADLLSESERFQAVDHDWSDPNEVTVRSGAQIFRVTVRDVTEEMRP